jgi:hypothetical protein
MYGLQRRVDEAIHWGCDVVAAAKFDHPASEPEQLKAVAARKIIKWLPGILYQLISGRKGRLGVGRSSRFGARSGIPIQAGPARTAIKRGHSLGSRKSGYPPSRFRSEPTPRGLLSGH